MFREPKKSVLAAYLTMLRTKLVGKFVNNYKCLVLKVLTGKNIRHPWQK